MTTGFWWDERCFWHVGGNYAFILPVGGLVQPLASGGLPESPETKRRLKNLLDVTGLIGELDVSSAPPATEEDLRRVHPAEYLDDFRALSDAHGGELGEHAPFGAGSFEIAALSAGLAKAAVMAVAEGRQSNAYALSRPPGHHCLPAQPMGFCLLANLAFAVETAIAAGSTSRVAVVDWDVHHGNGTEAIFYDRDDVLTISLHQDNNFPLGTGGVEARGEGAGVGFNINVPLQPGAGHDAYIHAFRRIVLPALQRYGPDLIVIACGYDASCIDPLSRTMATSETFFAMTDMLMRFADEACGGRLVVIHEGGYAETHVPFCGHAVLQRLSGSSIEAPDPYLSRSRQQQPDDRFAVHHRDWIDRIAAAAGLAT